jgi:hypothetical protein
MTLFFFALVTSLLIVKSFGEYFLYNLNFIDKFMLVALIKSAYIHQAVTVASVALKCVQVQFACEHHKLP